MKEPLIRECPCCDLDLDECIGAGVRPICKQASDNNGLLACELYWQCLECGCEWRHGQFEEDTQCPPPKAA
jgi:hypothetical protein